VVSTFQLSLIFKLTTYRFDYFPHNLLSLKKLTFLNYHFCLRNFLTHECVHVKIILIHSLFFGFVLVRCTSLHLQIICSFLPFLLNHIIRKFGGRGEVWKHNIFITRLICGMISIISILKRLWKEKKNSSIRRCLI